MKAQQIIDDLDLTIELFKNMEVKDTYGNHKNVELEAVFQIIIQKLTHIKEWATWYRSSIDIFETRPDAK